MQQHPKTASPARRLSSESLWKCKSGCRVQGSGCRVQGAGCRVQGAGFRVQGSGCRVQSEGCRVQGSGFMVQGAGCRVQCAVCRVQGAGVRAPPVRRSSSELPCPLGGVRAVIQKSMSLEYEPPSEPLVSTPRKSAGYVAKCAPHKALELIA